MKIARAVGRKVTAYKTFSNGEVYWTNLRRLRIIRPFENPLFSSKKDELRLNVWKLVDWAEDNLSIPELAVFHGLGQYEWPIETVAYDTGMKPEKVYDIWRAVKERLQRQWQSISEE